MKVRAILKSLLFAYALTGVALLLLAGKIVRKDKYLWGVITGLAYYVLLLTVSVMAKGGWDMSAAHAVTTFFMCTGGGTLGGMLS